MSEVKLDLEMGSSKMIFYYISMFYIGSTVLLAAAAAAEQRLKVREISQRLTDVFFIVDLNNE